MPKVQRKRKDAYRHKRIALSSMFVGVVAGGISVVVGVVGVVFGYREHITSWLRTAARPAENDRSSLPPASADFLLCLFLSRHNRRQLIGDLTEEFHEDVLPKFGVRAARIWYWKKALGAIMERNPITRRMLVGTGLFKVGEWIWKTFAG